MPTTFSVTQAFFKRNVVVSAKKVSTTLTSLSLIRLHQDPAHNKIKEQRLNIFPALILVKNIFGKAADL